MTPPGAPAFIVVDSSSRAEMVRALRGRPVAVDVETVGMDPRRPGARLRMVQVGAAPGQVWIDLAPGAAISDVLRAAPALIGHNLTFDLLWLDHAGLLRLEEATDRVVDTHHLAHLRDNRTRRLRRSELEHDEWDEAALLDDHDAEDDAVGHALKDLADHHLGPDADAARRRLWAACDLPPATSPSFTAAWGAIPDDHRSCSPTPPPTST